MFNINVRKAMFAFKNALILTYATSTIMSFAINIIVRILTVNAEMGDVPPDWPVGEGNLLDYYWAHLSLHSQIFLWVFAITLIQITIAKKVNKKSA